MRQSPTSVSQTEIGKSEDFEPEPSDTGNESEVDEVFNEEFDVAVKICKKDVDVTSFKALLLEVKVMVYLGQHENIVSLIGASTKNIRNRNYALFKNYSSNKAVHPKYVPT